MDMSSLEGVNEEGNLKKDQEDHLLDLMNLFLNPKESNERCGMQIYVSFG